MQNNSDSLFIFYENIFYQVNEIIEVEDNSFLIKTKILFIYIYKKLNILRRKIKKIFNLSLMRKK